MKKNIFLFLLFAVPAGLFAQFSGNWMGVLHITKQDTLRVGITITQNGDSLSAVMDSPDQYQSDIKVSSVSINGDTLRFQVNSAGASYKGVLDKQTGHIHGIFKQNRKGLPLTFNPVTERVIAKRPQTPKPPFPYQEEDVNIDYHHAVLGKISITGTLTKPSAGSSSMNKLIILISGSGWQDRNETIMGHQPFAVIADYFTRLGYAVFRYDDVPRAQMVKCTTLDFADIAEYIVRYFHLFNDYTKTFDIILAGHSEGGTIAMMVASRNENVKAVVSLAGMTAMAKQVLLYQIGALGKLDSSLTQEEKQQSLVISYKMYSLIEKSKTSKDAAQKCTKLLQNYAAMMSEEARKKLNLTQTRIYVAVQQLTSPWYFELFHLQPVKYVKKVKCPVLSLNGLMDKQVEANLNQEILKRNLPKNTRLVLKTYPRLNHLFQTCMTGLPSEYGTIEETFNLVPLQDILTFLKSL